MPGCVGERSILSPPRHPSNDEARIPFQKLIRSKPKTFQHTGAETFNHAIGLFEHAEQRLFAFRMLDVQTHGFPVARENVELRFHSNPDAAACAVNSYDFCAHVS